ncbi:MAG TPA: tRNA threonylcarbamoyladenosine dehydratase [Candidatus Omnitrophota bacterium]|nr:tRNA threonylcarbamoyladenosine dehydratase [Candidatus Omnitrophota bacterium]
MDRFLRTELLIGKKKLKQLQHSFVVVVGLGAVGSYALEALARAGVGKFRLVDFDIIRPTNINRHLHAFDSTVGMSKAMTAYARVRDINPRATVAVMETFASLETLREILGGKPDLVIDAIDSLNPKVQLLTACFKKKIPVISSMGAAVRTDPFSIRVGDIFDTACCPLAARLRKRLRKENVGRGITCVYSEQKQSMGTLMTSASADSSEYTRGRVRKTLGSLPTLTGMFGLFVAHTAIEKLCGGFPGS